MLIHTDNYHTHKIYGRGMSEHLASKRLYLLSLIFLLIAFQPIFYNVVILVFKILFVRPVPITGMRDSQRVIQKTVYLSRDKQDSYNLFTL